MAGRARMAGWALGSPNHSPSKRRLVLPHCRPFRALFPPFLSAARAHVRTPPSPAHAQRGAGRRGPGSPGGRGRRPARALRTWRFPANERRASLGGGGAAAAGRAGAKGRGGGRRAARGRARGRTGGGIDQSARLASRAVRRGGAPIGRRGVSAGGRAAWRGADFRLAERLRRAGGGGGSR